MKNVGSEASKSLEVCNKTGLSRLSGWRPLRAVCLSKLERKESGRVQSRV